MDIFTWLSPAMVAMAFIQLIACSRAASGRLGLNRRWGIQLPSMLISAQTWRAGHRAALPWCVGMFATSGCCGMIGFAAGALLLPAVSIAAFAGGLIGFVMLGTIGSVRADHAAKVVSKAEKQRILGESNLPPQTPLRAKRGRARAKEDKQPVQAKRGMVADVEPMIMEAKRLVTEPVDDQVLEFEPVAQFEPMIDAEFAPAAIDDGLETVEMIEQPASFDLARRAAQAPDYLPPTDNGALEPEAPTNSPPDYLDSPFAPPPAILNQAKTQPSPPRLIQHFDLRAPMSGHVRVESTLPTRQESPATHELPQVRDFIQPFAPTEIVPVGSQAI